eukprot:2498255-Prorocentrum_lima.AAC.1
MRALHYWAMLYRVCSAFTLIKPRRHCIYQGCKTRQYADLCLRWHTTDKLADVHDSSGPGNI